MKYPSLWKLCFPALILRRKKDFEIRVASISAGLCMCTKGDSFDECSSKADKALYYVKQNGKHNFFFYQQMDNTVFPVSSVAKRSFPLWQKHFATAETIPEHLILITVNFLRFMSTSTNLENDINTIVSSSWSQWKPLRML